jgi:hypothetical protein
MVKNLVILDLKAKIDMILLLIHKEDGKLKIKIYHFLNLEKLKQ